jgi:hypothetical protein
LITHIRQHATYANVMASIALFLALGGTGYALSLPRNSVGTAQLKKNAVTGPKIKKNAVTTAKVRKNAINGVKVKNRSLAAVDLKVGQILVWGGTYDSGLAYPRYSVVYQDGSSYVATRPIAAGEDPSAGGGWREFAARGPQGDPGQDGTFAASGYHEDAMCVNELTGAVTSPAHSGLETCDDVTENAIEVVVKDH